MNEYHLSSELLLVTKLIETLLSRIHFHFHFHGRRFLLDFWMEVYKRRSLSMRNGGVLDYFLDGSLQRCNLSMRNGGEEIIPEIVARKQRDNARSVGMERTKGGLSLLSLVESCRELGVLPFFFFLLGYRLAVLFGSCGENRRPRLKKHVVYYLSIG